MTLILDFPALDDSTLARLDPRAKLAALAPAAFLLALLNTPWPAAVALLAALLLALAAQLPWRWLGKRLGWVALLLAIFLVWLPLFPDPNGETVQIGGINLSYWGLQRLAVVMLKTLAIITLFLVLLTTAPLYDTLKAAQALRLPGVLVQLFLLTLRYIYLLADEFVRLRTALRVRGYRNRADLHSWRTVGQVAGTLLVRGYERGERVSQAMRCRGFDGTYHSLHDSPMTWRDGMFVAAVLGAASGLLVWDVARQLHVW